MYTHNVHVYAHIQCRLVSFPDPILSREKGLVTFECFLGCARSVVAWLAIIICTRAQKAVAMKQLQKWRAAIWLACTKTRLLILYNQENAQLSPDPFPHARKRWGLGDETTYGFTYLWTEPLVHCLALCGFYHPSYRHMSLPQIWIPNNESLHCESEAWPADLCFYIDHRVNHMYEITTVITCTARYTSGCV